MSFLIAAESLSLRRIRRAGVSNLTKTFRQFEISGLLTSVGKASREALILKKPTKIVEKLSVNSRCNRIYKELISTPVDIALQTVKNSGPSERKAVQA